MSAGRMPNREILIQGRDGFYVRQTFEHGAWYLCAGHKDIVGGLFSEWSDCESHTVKRTRARRMIAQARRAARLEATAPTGEQERTMQS